MPEDDDLNYLKRIANPVCCLTKTQQTMLGSFKKNVDRQSQSRQVRLRILAEKRNRIHTPSVVDEQSDVSEHMKHSEEPTESDEPSESETQKTPETAFRMFTPPTPVRPLYVKPVTPIPVTPLPVEDAYEDSDMDRKLYEDELDSRMEDLGIGKQQDESIRT